MKKTGMYEIWEHLPDAWEGIEHPREPWKGHNPFEWDRLAYRDLTCPRSGDWSGACADVCSGTFMGESMVG